MCTAYRRCCEMNGDIDDLIFGDELPGESER